MVGGNTGIEGSTTVPDVFVRSEARRRALAVARRDGIGGGGERDVSVVRRVCDGGGRDWARIALRSWGMRSIVVYFGDCECVKLEVEAIQTLISMVEY